MKNPASIGFMNYEIASADPLRIDDRISRLAENNHSGNVGRLIDDLQYATDRAAQTPVNAPVNAFAVTRDIDFIASSILRAGTNPTEYVPELESVLVGCAAVTQMVPRGTVYTYASANPSGERQRSFTGTPEEKIFIKACKVSMESLGQAVEPLSRLKLYVAPYEDIADSLESCAEACGVLTNSIVTVHRNLSPGFFTREMRPYFEPLTVNGREYVGAGGAQMQLLAMERILWGVDDPNEIYQKFYRESIEYLTPDQRTHIDRFIALNESSSVFSYVMRQNDPELSQHLYNTLLAIRKFRYPHKKVADDNFKLRDKSAVGSGAYTPEILEVLIDKIEEKMELLQGKGDAKN